MRAVRLLVNWTILLTVPIWGGTVLLISMIHGVVSGLHDFRAPFRTGKEWIWE